LVPFPVIHKQEGSFTL